MPLTLAFIPSNRFRAGVDSFAPRGKRVNLDWAPVAPLSFLAEDRSALNTVLVTYSVSKKLDCAKEARRYNM